MNDTKHEAYNHLLVQKSSCKFCTGNACTRDRSGDNYRTSWGIGEALDKYNIWMDMSGNIDLLYNNIILLIG